MLRCLILVLLFSGSFCFAFDQNDIVPNEVIVKFKDGQNHYRVMGKLAASAQVKSQKAWPQFNLHQFSTKPGDKIEDVISRLQQDPNVEFAEPNYYVRAYNFPTIMTNSPMRVSEAWRAMPRSQSIEDLPIVAIIDSGLDLNHQVFDATGRVAVNSGEIPNNGFDDDGNGFIDDVEGWNFVSDSPNVVDETGHGTHVAGIVLGSTENIVNFDSSSGPRIRILPLKFLNSEGVGKTSDAVQAVSYAISRGAKVINNSWGGNQYSASLHSALSSAYQQGIVIVSASGNTASNNDSTPVYPASLDIPSMISVAASRDNDLMADFSNYGPSNVHVFAPGVAIYSTAPRNAYATATGTSMSAPFVSGLAGMIASAAPHFSGYQIKQLIMQTADLRQSLAPFAASGGRINFENAIETALIMDDEVTYQPSYTPNLQSGSRGLASTNAFGETLGCARVDQFYSQQNNLFSQGGSHMHSSSLFHLLLLLIPFMFILFYRFRFFKKSRRKYFRVSVEYSGQMVTNHGMVFPVKVKDLSPAGAGLQIVNFQNGLKLEKTTGIILNLLFADGEKAKLKGRVQRFTSKGFIGIEFKKYD